MKKRFKKVINFIKLKLYFQIFPAYVARYTVYRVFRSTSNSELKVEWFHLRNRILPPTIENRSINRKLITLDYDVIETIHVLSGPFFNITVIYYNYSHINIIKNITII